jgi:hypothetical protein
MNLALLLATEQLTPATCTFCRARIWSWPNGQMADGRVVGFDLVEAKWPGDRQLLLLHDCLEQEDWPEETMDGWQPPPDWRSYPDLD